MDVLTTALGVILIATGLHDMFHTLLHPAGRGMLTRVVFRAGWRISRHTGHRIRVVIGPAMMMITVLLWVSLQTLGWALIYLPHLPDEFAYSTGLNPAEHNDFAEALYVSLVTLTTVGFGDVVANDTWVRLASPVEALIGFAVLTAAVSWFTQVYPALARRRTLAFELACLAEAGYADTFEEHDSASIASTLDRLTVGVAQTCVDLTQNSETYYFGDPTPHTSLARHLAYAETISHQAAQCPNAKIRTRAHCLANALDAFTTTLKERFAARGDSPAEILQNYATEHGTPPHP